MSQIHGLNMQDLLRTVRDLKTSAKNRRDLGVRGYPKAVLFLDKAIAQLVDAFDLTSSAGSRSELASEFADCYGLLGGIQRRWGLDLDPGDERLQHLASSIRAYDRGYEFESAEEFGIANSYNLVNRLVSRIFYDPKTLSDTAAAISPEGVEALNVKEELQKAEEIVREQLKLKRRGDVWALADLALIELLLERGDAASIYGAFNAASPPDYAYSSALDTLEELAKLNLPSVEKLKEATRQLKTRRDLMRR